MKKIILLILVLIPVITFSQTTITITGKVIDEYGDAIPGATVISKKYPKVGTITDMKGKYSITVPQDAQVLIFSYIGKKKVEKQINGRTVINVTLEPREEEIECIVVSSRKAVRKKESKVGYACMTVNNKSRVSKSRPPQYDEVIHNTEEYSNIKSNEFNNSPLNFRLQFYRN